MYGCAWVCMCMHVCMCVCVPGCVLVMHWHIKTANLKMKTAPAMCCGGCNCSPPHCCRIMLLLTAQLLPVQNTHMLLPHAETKVKFSGCNYRAISAEFPFAVCYTASALACNLPHFCGTQGWQHAKILSLNSKVWCSIAVEQQHQQQRAQLGQQS